MSKCKICGAIYRVNYPHGRMSKGIATFEKEHSNNCRYKKK